MRSRTLLTQVLAVNTLLVAITAFVAAVVARDRLREATSTEGLLLIVLAIFSAVLLNRMLARLEDERRNAGRAVLRAQEQERARIAQDLHDEVNQALTAILLRLSATIQDAPVGLRSELQQTQELVSQAMDELLALARQLRPTALDDHGLIAALAGPVSDFGQRTGVQARFHHHGAIPKLSDEEQLVIFRVTQESLSNIAKHARARDVDVELSFVGRTVLRVRDDGGGFDTAAPRSVNGSGNGRVRGGGLGLSGMRERALLVG